MITSNWRTKPVWSLELRASNNEIREFKMNKREKSEIATWVMEDDDEEEEEEAIFFALWDDCCVDVVEDLIWVEEMRDSQAPMTMNPPPAEV